ncbi:MAG TPA: hypothetical protein VFT72_03715 [Opitutaceae bacterium]|nr:hypothetical protein [Opitutaceae bacterium]
MPSRSRFSLALLPLLLAASLLITGCSTVKTRIDEKSALFNSLPAEVQDHLRQGLIDVGYTEDMVYIALGKPDEKRVSTTAEGTKTTWIYNTYWEEYEGTQTLGYRRHIVYDRRIRAYRVYLQPVRQDIYQAHVDEKTRVIFKDGKVEAIEQTNN